MNGDTSFHQYPKLGLGLTGKILLAGVKRKIKNFIDIVWLVHDCFSAYIFTNYLGRWSRVVTQRSSSSAPYIARLVDCLTLMLRPGFTSPALWDCGNNKKTNPTLHRLIFVLLSSPHNRNNTLKQHQFQYKPILPTTLSRLQDSKNAELTSHLHFFTVLVPWSPLVSLGHIWRGSHE